MNRRSLLALSGAAAVAPLGLAGCSQSTQDVVAYTSVDQVFRFKDIEAIFTESFHGLIIAIVSQYHAFT